MRYHLRTLLIVLALVPLLIAGAWSRWTRFNKPKPPPDAVYRGPTEWAESQEKIHWARELYKKR